VGGEREQNDNSGAIQTQYTYEPFGKTTITGENSSNPFQYTGRENDGIGVYYYRTRYYNPVLQRFAGEDLLLCGRMNRSVVKSIEKNSQALNAFVYVNNSPINLRDPLGLSPDCGDRFAASLLVCGAYQVAYVGVCTLICEFTGPAAPECLFECTVNVCNPIYRSCFQAAVADYLTCPSKKHDNCQGRKCPPDGNGSGTGLGNGSRSF
jgi:RHS repeat-associated protein